MDHDLNKLTEHFHDIAKVEFIYNWIHQHIKSTYFLRRTCHCVHLFELVALLSIIKGAKRVY